MPLSLGFIGAGNIIRYHMKNARAAGFELVSVADVAPAAALEAKAQFDLPEYYSSHTDLLKSSKVDGVVIGVPNKFHAQCAIDSLRAGKHVFLEKPMAMNVIEADAIL